MARSKWISFGAQQQLERAAKAAAPAIIPVQSSADAKKFGLENFGNTCYANSVLQALYFCTPFRDLLLQDVESMPPPNSSPVIPSTLSKPPPPLVPLRRKPERNLSTSGHISEPSVVASSQNLPHPIPPSPPTLFSALQSLFLNISTNPGDKGTVAPRAFIDKLKELNELFRSTMHQDAHEFLNYLLNRIVEEIEEDRKQVQNGGNGEDLSCSVPTLGSKTPPTFITTTTSSNSGTHPHDATLVHTLFEGVLTSETRCLTCESVSSRDESFLDLSIDIEQNSSLTACLRQFSASEMLCQRNKFFCDSCCDLQEAEKRMKIKKLPNVLALHLKRFKYQEDVGKYIKLAYRVAFPFELRLFNTVDDMDDADRLYYLFAIVVHIGNGPHHGHYISIIKTVGTWLVFDDDNVYPIPESDIPKYFGDSNSGSAYVLYYQAVDIDLAALGLRSPEPEPPSELLTNVIPDLRRSPLLQSQQTPTLPPGLNAISSLNGDVDYPAAAAPSSIWLPPQAPFDIPSLVASPVPLSAELPPPPTTVPTASSSPMTPTGFGRQIFNTIRRAPSITTPRTSGTSHGNPTASGHDHRRSMTEKSPRPSTSTPSFVAGTEVVHEVPPPIPPLPSSLYNNAQQSPTCTTPIFVPHFNEPEKEEKEKAKSSTGWFSRKRKSLRIGEKLRPSTAPALEMPPSPFLRGDEVQQPQSVGWFKSSTSTGNAPRPQRRPSENGAAVPSEIVGLHPDSLKLKTSSGSTKHERNHRSNGYDDAHSPGSRSSSPSTTSLSTGAQGTAGSSATRPSTSVSSSSSGTQLEFPPARTASLVPSSAEWSRSSFDRKQSADLKTMTSPLTTSSLLPSIQTASDQSRLFPLPTTPKHTHRFNVSNGHIFVSEPESMLKGKSRSTEDDSPPLHTSPDTHPSRSMTLPPSSLATSVGANNSSGSNSTSSNIKRATRKLSLTAPMLGFGKKVKDREKEKARERERDSLSPSAFNNKL